MSTLKANKCVGLLSLWILFGFWLMPASAEKGDIWLDINLGSIHEQNNYFWEGEVRSYNEFNPGLGITYEINDLFDAKAGFFHNSYEELSSYVMIGFSPSVFSNSNSDWKVDVGGGIGLITGYDDTPEQAEEISPWLMAIVGIEYKERYRFNIGYLPSSLFFETGVDVVMGQFSIKF